MKSIILEAKDLCKKFSTNAVEQQVLNNLNVTFYEGDFTIIMGASGSGKSTLLYALSGMDKPTSGKISFCHTDISNYSNEKLAIFRRDNCGFVFQQNYLNDKMNILDNILVNGYLSKRPRKQVLERAKELLKIMGLKEELYYKFPTQLSGGEAQRLSIARAQINEPSVVFADEPTGALNSHSAKEVLDFMVETNERGQSIIMVTHDIRTAVRGNRLIYLKDGVILDELYLPKYKSEDEQKRISQVQEFLNKMGW